MRLYLAGPLFSQAERAWLDALAARLRAEGFDPFVPHEHFGEIDEVTPEAIFRVDVRGVREADALVAWIDGPMCDDGTAVELGIFAQLCADDPARYRGIVGIATDLRLERRRGNVVGELHRIVARGCSAAVCHNGNAVGHV